MAPASGRWPPKRTFSRSGNTPTSTSHQSHESGLMVIPCRGFKDLDSARFETHHDTVQ